MSCLEHICPVQGCDQAVMDNDPSVHRFPIHGEPMIRQWDEQEVERDPDYRDSRMFTG